MPPVHNPSQISGSSARPGGMREPSLETLVSLIRLYKATATKPNTALRPQGARRISSLRAFRWARDSEAKGRVDWKRSRWPDAKFEVAGAKCALRNDRSPAQSFARSLTHSLAREKREETGSRTRKTATTKRREKRGEGRAKREERREKRREKREDRRQKRDQKRPPEVPE